MSVDSKTKRYRIYQGITLFFIFLHQPSVLQRLQLQALPIGIMMIEALV